MRDRVIFFVDMQSFYASVEKADHPEFRDRPVIVSGDPERRSGIILAACPLAKKYGVETAEALWQAEQKCPDAVIVRPRMQRYIEMSLQITEILEGFTDLVEPYSIDEQFLDVTGSQKLFGTPEQIAKKIQRTIWEKTHVYSRVGMGPNKILAKMACDNFAKKNADGLFWLDETNIKDTLWRLPIHKMFGVGTRMTEHFRRMGIRTIGHLAEFPLDRLRKRWGINGEVLWLTANGKDTSPVKVQTHDTQKAIGHHMTLPRDYKTLSDIRVILLELSEEVARRARAKNYQGKTLSVGARGIDFDHPTGFYRQTKLAFPTNFGTDLYKSSLSLFNLHWDGLPVRSLGITLSDLQPADHYQLRLFDAPIKKERLGKAMDIINDKYGTATLVRAASLLAAGQAYERAKKIGGHYK